MTGTPAATDDTDRQTDLAVERTELAWWRTGLTALAVAIGVGRVVPELNPSETRWPYITAGILFALYAIALFARGTARARSLLPAEDGRRQQRSAADALLVAAGPFLGVLVIALIVATA